MSRRFGGKQRLIPVAILLMAFGVRLVGIGWALPYVHHSDEPTSLRVVQTMVRDRTVNPHFFLWPSLPLYIQAVPYTAYAAFGVATDRFESVEAISLPAKQNVGSTLLHNPRTLTIGRLTTAVFSLGIVAAGMWLVTRVTGRRSIGVVAGVLLALDPMLVSQARWMTPDTYAALFAILAVALAIRVLESGRTLYYVLAGGAVGLAASCKYNVAVVGLAVGVAHGLRYGRRFLVVPGIYAAALAAAVAFVATTPAVLFAPGEVSTALEALFSHNSTGHTGAEGDQARFYFAGVVRDMGPLLLLIPFAFAAATRRAALVIAALPMAIALVLLPFPVRFERYLVPAIPGLIALAVIGGGNAVRMIRHHAAARVARRAAVAVLALVLAFSMDGVIDEWRRLAGDNRLQAQTWFYENAAPGARVMVDGYSPWIDPTLYQVSAHSLVLAYDTVFVDAPEYIFLAHGGSGRFRSEPDRYPAEAARYTRLLGSYCIAAQFGGPEPIEILIKCDR